MQNQNKQVQEPQPSYNEVYPMFNIAQPPPTYASEYDSAFESHKALHDLLDKHLLKHKIREHERVLSLLDAIDE